MVPETRNAPLPTTARFMACAALAVVLNAAALGVVAHTQSTCSAVAPLDDAAPRHQAMVLIPAVPTAPPLQRSVVPATSEVEPVGAPSPKPAPPKARTIAAPAAISPPVLFYPFGEVDNPAYPAADWNLDVDALDQAGVRRLVFEVLVNDRGDVVGCTVLDPTGLPDDTRRDLEKRLSETRLLPAERAGRLVASMRRIELVVADEVGDFTAGGAGAAPAHRP